MNDLLPPTARQVSAGRHGFVTVREPGVQDQLLALCRLRATTKSWNRLAILLWLEGWKVPVDRVRAAVLAELPPVPAGPWTDKRLDELHALARKHGPSLVSRLRIGRIGGRLAEDATHVVLSVAVGATQVFDESEVLDETAATMIERISGMHRRARQDTVEGVGPWLTGPAVAGLATWARSFSITRIRRLVEKATEADFLTARGRARFVARDLPATVRVLELGQGRNPLGLGLFGRLASGAPHLGIIAALWAPGAHLAEQLDDLAAACPDRVPVAKALDALELYWVKHPEQRRVMASEGIMGLHRRGLLVPLTADELGFDLAALVAGA